MKLGFRQSSPSLDLQHALKRSLSTNLLGKESLVGSFGGHKGICTYAGGILWETEMKNNSQEVQEILVYMILKKILSFLIH